MSKHTGVVLVTGGARRIGAAICRELHQLGWQVLIHYCSSAVEANALAEELNQARPDSARCFKADLQETEQAEALASAALGAYGELHALVNNASAFYPTPIGSVSSAQWTELMASNLRAPFFLAQALSPALRSSEGSIVNLVDVHASKPMRNHSIYSMAKAGLQMMTQSLALELAPEIRVNAIAPGAILWPENASMDMQDAILEKIPLGRIGTAEDIARTARFLITEAPYITGQVIAVDGGRSLNM